MHEGTTVSIKILNADCVRMPSEGVLKAQYVHTLRPDHMLEYIGSLGSHMQRVRKKLQTPMQQFVVAIAAGDQTFRTQVRVHMSICVDSCMYVWWAGAFVVVCCAFHRVCARVQACACVYVYVCACVCVWQQEVVNPQLHKGKETAQKTALLEKQVGQPRGLRPLIEKVDETVKKSPFDIWLVQHFDAAF